MTQKRKKKNIKSADMAREMLKEHGEEKSIVIVKEKISKSTNASAEVYWKAVLYRIKTREK